MKTSSIVSNESFAQKTMSLILALTLAMGMIPAVAFAEVEEVPESPEPKVAETPTDEVPEGQTGEDAVADGEVAGKPENEEAAAIDGEAADVPAGEEDAVPADAAASSNSETDATKEPAEFLGEEEAIIDAPQAEPAENPDSENVFALQAGENADEGTWGDCSWSLDSEGTLTVWPTNNESGRLDDSHPFSDNTEIQSVVFEDGVALPRICIGLFDGCTNLRSINFSGVDASAVVTMQAMFAHLSSLESIDLSGLDTSSVSHMDSMFDGCSSLVSANLSGLDTSSVIGMSALFEGCSSLESVDLSGLNTSSVIDMSGMFHQCSSLTSLDLSGLNTSSVTNMGYMFYDCRLLKTLDLTGFDTSSTTNMYEMFYNCQSLESLDLSGFDTSSVTNMGSMFRDCSSLQSVTLGSGFSFMGDGSTSCKLPDAPADDTYSGKWTNGTQVYAASELASEYDGSSMAGTWEWELLMSESTVTLPNKTVTYTGKKVAMSGAKVTGSTGAVTYAYYSDAACTKELSADKVVNAGTYYVKATVAADDNYNEATSNAAKLVIAKAASTVTLPAKTATYTGKKIAMSGAKVKGSAGKVTYTYYSDSKCKKKVSASKVKAVGTYYVKATVAADSNYKAATSKAAKLTVNPRPTALKSVKGYTVKDKGHYGNKGLKIKWAKPKSECAGVQFRVRVYDKKSAKWKTVQSEKAPKASYPTGCTVGKKSLKKKTAYQVQVRTYKKVSGKYYYSTWSKAKTAKTPK